VIAPLLSHDRAGDGSGNDAGGHILSQARPWARGAWAATILAGSRGFRVAESRSGMLAMGRKA